jgi:hypothetical protein
MRDELRTVVATEQISDDELDQFRGVSLLDVFNDNMCVYVHVSAHICV